MLHCTKERNFFKKIKEFDLKEGISIPTEIISPLHVDESVQSEKLNIEEDLITERVWFIIFFWLIIINKNKFLKLNSFFTYFFIFIRSKW